MLAHAWRVCSPARKALPAGPEQVQTIPILMASLVVLPLAELVAELLAAVLEELLEELLEEHPARAAAIASAAAQISHL